MLALAGSTAALVFALALGAHLLWTQVVAPIDAAAGVMGQMAGAMAPEQVEDARSSTATALRDAQSKLLRDQQANDFSAEAGGRLAEDRSDVGRSLDSFGAARGRP